MLLMLNYAPFFKINLDSEVNNVTESTCDIFW